MKSDQSYYWADEWQANEQAADEEIHNGDVKRFATVDEAIAWLLSDN